MSALLTCIMCNGDVACFCAKCAGEMASASPPTYVSDDGGWNDATAANYERAFGSVPAPEEDCDPIYERMKAIDAVCRWLNGSGFPGAAKALYDSPARQEITLDRWDSSAACQISTVSSRVCEFGTKSCTMSHGATEGSVHAFDERNHASAADGTFVDENAVRRECAGGEPVNSFIPGPTEGST